MKKTKIISTITAAALALSCMATSAFAADESEKTVVVAAEAFTLGLGFVSLPAEITLADDETAADAIEKLIGAENINDGSGAGTYISSVNADATNAAVLPEIEEAITAAGGELTTAADSSRIAAFDYYSMSGWQFLVNNESASVGIGDYIPEEGDVIRLSFTVFGYGSDLGLDTSSMAEWGGTAPLFPQTNRDEIYKAFAANTVSEEELMTAADLNAAQEALDEIVLAAESDLIDDEEEAIDEIDEEAAPEEEVSSDEEAAPEDEEISSEDEIDETADNENVDTTETTGANETDTTNSAENPETGINDASAFALLGGLAAILFVGEVIKKKK